MITYVNKVFVSNTNQDTLLSSVPDSSIASYKGRFIVYDIDNAAYDVTAATKRFKIGMLTGATIKDHEGKAHAEIKWSNIINIHDIKSISALSYAADTEDAIYINFGNTSVIGTEASGDYKVLSKAGKRIITRLTFKDMIGFRYRKWTESYEYITKDGDTSASIAAGIADIINKQWKRARVSAVVGSINTTDTSNNGVIPGSTTKYFHTDTNWGSSSATTGAVLKLEALPYDDDDAVETLNWAEKVRFNANIYYTDPAAEGWESLNKHFPTGTVITKVPGNRYAASAKLVRDREAQGMGYDGILNRGNGTWPIIKPAMETQLDAHYNALTVEFENMYRAADDIFRKTKQAVEIYSVNSSVLSAISSKIATAQAGAGVASVNAAVAAMNNESTQGTLAYRIKALEDAA